MNKLIIASAAGITGTGIVNAMLQGKPLTRVVMGGYMAAIALSVLDLFGGAMSQLAGGIALVALVTVLLTEIDWAAFAHGIVATTGGQGKGEPTAPRPPR